MADIEFEAGDAKVLAKAVRSAADTLRCQSGTRSASAEAALADFAGSYADRFNDAVVIEAEDRGRLVGVLTDLASALDRAVELAEQERERVRAHAAWKLRDADRQRAANAALAGPFSGVAIGVWDTFVDREPSDEPLRPPVVDAEFRGRERARYGTGASGGKSSADPAALRGFVSAVAGLDTAASAEATRVRSAWSSFRSSCAWVQVDRGSMPAGFERYVAENDQDRSWITKTAQAFEDAGGGGALSDAVLDIAAMGREAPAVQRLLADHLTPAQVAARWAALGLTKADADALRALPTSVLSELGNLEGMPYWARSTANVVVLNQRMGDVELEIESLLASVASTGDEGAARAAAHRIAALKTELRSLRNINATMAKKGAEGQRYLISLTDDQPPLAAVSIGDLDTADSVTWAVPGMNTTTADMSSWTMAAQNIYDEQGRAAVDGGFSGTHAVVSWIGYDTPTPAEVLFMGKAKRGGEQLAESIRGLGPCAQSGCRRRTSSRTRTARPRRPSRCRNEAFTSIGSWRSVQRGFRTLSIQQTSCTPDTCTRHRRRTHQWGRPVRVTSGLPSDETTALRIMSTQRQGTSGQPCSEPTARRRLTAGSCNRSCTMTR